MSAQSCRIDLLAGPRQNVGDQNRVACRAVDTHSGRELDRRIVGQDSVDLAQFDAETTHLDLEVAAPDVFERSRLGPPHHIAGAVHPGTVLSERIRDETVCGQTGSVMVATCQCRPGEIELTYNPDRDGMQPRVENDLAETDCRSADVDGGVHLQSIADGREDRRLGRTVRVEHSTARCPAGHELGRAHIATGGDHGQLGQAVRINRRQCGGRDERMRDALCCEQFGQLDAAVDRGRRDDHGRGTGEHHEQFEDRGIEARGRERENPGVRGHLETSPLLLGQIRQPAVGDGDALGNTRRARGVDQVRDLIDVHRTNTVDVENRRGRVTREFGARVLVVEHGPPSRAEVCDRGHVLGQGQADRRVRVDEHVFDAIAWVARIDRQECRPGLGDCPDAEYRFDGPGQSQGNDGFRAGTACDQCSCES